MKVLKVVMAVFMLGIVIPFFISCKDNGDDLLFQTKAEAYIIDDNGETFLNYSIISYTMDNVCITELYSPDGVLWFTITDGKTVYTEAYTDEIAEQHNSTVQASAFALAGKNSDDLVYESERNDAGETVCEIFSSKSGEYTTYKIIYTKLK
jgi:hypothetical protein